MNEKLKEFIDSLTHWLMKNHGIKATITEETSDTCELALEDDDLDEEQFFIGPFADPGLSIRWVGAVNLVNYEGEPTTYDLVLANGIPMAAIARHVAGWACGLA